MFKSLQNWRKTTSPSFTPTSLLLCALQLLKSSQGRVWKVVGFFPLWGLFFRNSPSILVLMYHSHESYCVPGSTVLHWVCGDNLQRYSRIGFLRFFFSIHLLYLYLAFVILYLAKLLHPAPPPASPVFPHVSLNGFSVHTVVYAGNSWACLILSPPNSHCV